MIEKQIKFVNIIYVFPQGYFNFPDRLDAEFSRRFQNDFRGWISEIKEYNKTSKIGIIWSGYDEYHYVFNYQIDDKDFFPYKPRKIIENLTVLGGL